jgi:hypothetical protein
MLTDKTISEHSLPAWRNNTTEITCISFVRWPFNKNQHKSKDIKQNDCYTAAAHVVEMLKGAKTDERPPLFLIHQQ